MAANTCKMKEDVVLFYKGNHFTHVNITDRIASAMLKAQPILEKHFITYPAGYKPVSDWGEVIEAKHNLAEANKHLKKTLIDLRNAEKAVKVYVEDTACLLYTSPSPRDQRGSRMPSSA